MKTLKTNHYWFNLYEPEVWDKDIANSAMAVRWLHFLISYLKPSRDFLFQISERICFQIFDPKYDADSVPL